MQHERTIGSKGKGLWGMKGEQLPAYIQHVYNDMVEGGSPTGSATYRRAVGIVENWAEGHDGKGHKVSSETQAKAAAAIAEWEKLRAKRHAMTGAKKIGEAMTVRSTAVGYLNQDLSADEVGNLKVLEAASDAEDAKDKGADEASEGQPSVFCPRCRKKVKATKDGKCPTCGTDLSKAVAMAKKVSEAVMAALESASDGETTKLKCPKCDRVQAASNKTCVNCGHDLADARKAKFANS